MTPEMRRMLVEQIKAAGTYSKAFEDMSFMSRRETRPVRLQLELLKPETVLRDQNIRSTVVVFGSARLSSPEEAREALAECRRQLKAAPRDLEWRRRLKTAQLRVEQSRYYEEARRFSAMLSQASQNRKSLEFVVVTGGGPGIMEAANRGAYEVGAKSIGLNITLPHEQDPNPYITPELSFQFHYFSLRKMHFMMRAKALAAFPGGYGTMDELFETLTLIQTGKKSPIPVVLFGKKFWTRVFDWKFLADEGYIGHADLKLFAIVETAAEGWSHIQRHWNQHPAGLPTP